MKESDKDSQPDAMRVEDKRHWAKGEVEEGESEPASLQPTIVDELRRRADAAEKKLLDYIAAFKESQAEQDRFRERLSADVDRKVELKFGGLVTDLLELIDDLDLAIGHVQGVPSAAPLAKGVELARDRFLSTLDRHGVSRVDLEDSAFDPNVAEAVGVEPVKSREQDGKVIRTLRPGYQMGERVIRPARVIVGRLVN